MTKKFIGFVFFSACGVLIFLYTQNSIAGKKASATRSPSQSLQAATDYARAISVQNVDLRDLAEYSPETLPQAQVLIQSLRDRKDIYGYTSTTRIFYMALYGAPVHVLEEMRYPLFVFAKTGRDYKISKFDVTISNRHQITTVTAGASIPLRETRFKFDASLLQRKVVLTDEFHQGIKIIFPIGVGAIDPGLTEASLGNTIIMTPGIMRAYIDRKKSVRHSNGAHYGHKPYMPLVRIADRSVLPVAFHIFQTTMMRGFVSHGCMRMREADLYLMHDILSRGGLARIPVTVQLTLPSADDHPFPMMDDSYERMVDCSTLPRHGHEPQYAQYWRRNRAREREPHACADPTDSSLSFTQIFQGRPEFSRIQALQGDIMPRAQFAELMQQDDMNLNTVTPEMDAQPDAPEQMYDEDDYRSESV